MNPAYVEPPASYSGSFPAVFLAGGITDCPDWQQEARGLLADWPGAILNPRRRNFPINDPTAAVEQVAWEFEHLERATVVLFWFPPSTSPQPIALYELGRHAALGKPLVVGTDPDYSRRADVLLQLRHACPEITVRSTLYEICSEACLMVDVPL